ncbi:MAG: hypothetical protein HGJ94_12605 [Desulfosarcina sp.]|nr:hypothetical protein [Desulfosarcina sp.]MBC2744985.1 hypothetical protein [Desulfosarcina sp.]MBC2767893.1 hypothetical protein [Desulfosarcina sp.]
MKAFLRQLLALTTAVVLFLMPQAGLSEEWDLDERPWEKFGANLGVFISAVDSNFRIGSGVGLNIDVEKLLGLDTSNVVFRTDALWRFSKNRRHRLDFTWFSFRRDGNRQILEDITIGDGDDQIIIEAGTSVNAFFDLDIYELAYSYSFFQDDRIDLAAGIGLYIMPIDFGLTVSGLVDEQGSEKFTAPLPVLGLRMDIALTPQWFIRTGSQVFYLEYENFTGSVLEFRAAVEYNPWKHVGIGLGIDALSINVEADGEDWPGIDLKGEFDFNYTGLQLYLRLFF